MKKTLVLLSSIIVLYGCAPKEEAVSGSETPVSSSGFVFEYRGVAIPMNVEVAPILGKLGKAADYFEAPSCAFDGIEKVYTYGSFQIHTYENKGVDHVASVVVLDDSIPTREGLFLFSSVDDLLKNYGDRYTQNLGMYSYNQGKSKLSFLVENSKVVSIEYAAVP